MCGRYTLTITLDEFVAAFPGLKIEIGSDDFFPRYNIAPTQPIPVIRDDGDRQLKFHHWGLIPSWAKDKKFASRMINARSETAAQKPSFREAFRARRCLIPADGFFEWIKVEGTKKKLPVYIHLKSKAPFAFAGLWETWTSPQGEVIPSAVILTTEPNRLVAKVHNRMPVILPRDAYDLWLDPEEKDPAVLAHLLKPYPADQMAQYPVSTLASYPSNEGPQVIEPLQKLTLD
ncbi:MAG: SOS response-associated peptidase [Chloroflexota bacterium]